MMSNFSIYDKIMPVEPCHPKRDIYDCTCYSNEQLRNMAQHLKKKGVKIRTTGTRKQLWVAIRDALKDHCEYDFCWRTHPLLKEIVDDEMTNGTFRPLAPLDWSLHVEKPGKQGKYAWLSNFDIDAVLAQYQSIDQLQDFKFFCSVPIDFEKVKEGPAGLNIVDLHFNQGINHFAVVFNLDPHDKPGSHWCSLWASVPSKIIAFFDSYGAKPEPEIQDFMARCVAQGILGYNGKSIDPDKRIDIKPLYNPVRHQRANSECGMYSLHYICEMLLSGGSEKVFNTICTNIKDDELINSFRKRLFVDSGKRIIRTS